MDRVVHFELPAVNMSRAKKFYSSVFGWKTTDIPKMNYTMVNTVAVGKDRMPKERGAINGGMMKSGGVFRAPVITVNVKNIDAAIKKVVKAGGKQVGKKQKVMGMGYNAYVKDTEGNVIGIWQALM